jgi:transposase
MEATSTIEIQSFQRLYEKEKNEKEALRIEVMKLQLQLHKLTQIVFGGKSERFVVNPAQLTLDIKTQEAAPATKLCDAKKIEYVKTGTPKKRDLSELGAYMQHLDHVYETREPDNLPADAIKIGEDHHQILEQSPGKTFVRVIVIPKYKIASKDDSDQTLVIAAGTPERPLFKCVAGASLLAQILVDKFCDHLPLFGQHKRFERNGVSIPYNTFIDWTAKAIDKVAVLGDALLKEIIASSYIHVDETGLPVLLGKENSKSKKMHNGYLWGYHSSIKSLVYFDYQPGRGEKHTIGILKNFHGIIQTDGWHVYEGVAAKQKDIRQICCMAHARRKFVDAMAYDKERAQYALTKFGALYKIESNCKEQGLSYDEIAKVRQREAVPVLEELHKWMLQEYKTLLPPAHITTAIGYCLERWERLCHYTTDGMLHPDNNPVERSIRPVVVGRKNYLFAGSHKGAERLAMMYSLLGTCKLNGVNPYDWLKDVLDKINNWPINRIHELLPHNWKLANDKPSK